MSYKYFGLDETKRASDPGKIQDSYCLWCSKEVTSGFSMCFNNWAICIECSDEANQEKNKHRWIEADKCFKCHKTTEIGYRSHESLMDLFLCPDCIKWSNEVFETKKPHLELTKTIKQVINQNMSTFFKELTELIGDSEITITIKQKDESLTVMVMPKHTTQDPALNQLKPVIISGTAQELDEYFLPTISEPLQKAIGLISNTTDYVKHLDAVASKTKQAKEKSELAKKEADEKKKKYDDLLLKADKAEKELNFSNAISILTQAKEFADKPEKVDSKIKALQSKIPQTGLFGAPIDDIIEEEELSDDQN
jgi:PRTRC genetic system protein E